MAETIQRRESFDVEGALIEREELELISGAVEYRHWNAERVLDEQRPATPEETAYHEAWLAGQDVEELQAKIRLEIDQNKQFLALDPPTNAQNAQQIQNLTRQSNGVMRQLIGFYDDIDGSELEVTP